MIENRKKKERGRESRKRDESRRKKERGREVGRKRWSRTGGRRKEREK